jgi:hypothetical protein
MTVLYQNGQYHICGGVTGSDPDRKWRDRKWRRSHDRKWSHAHAQLVHFVLLPCSTVVQVPWLLEVTERVTLPRRDGRVCAFATESCAISALVGPFDWKWRYETSTVVTDGHVTPSWFPWVCAISALVGPFERK